MKKTLIALVITSIVGVFPVHAAAPSTIVSSKTVVASDSVALGLLAAVNQHEIEAGMQAKLKKVSAPVLKFANKMIAEHGKNLAETKKLGMLTNNAAVMAQKAEGKQDLAMLGKKTGKAYETAYVNAMVKGHGDVLALIDNKLMPMATSQAVKQHLTATRHHVEMHLTEAKALQAAGK